MVGRKTYLYPTSDLSLSFSWVGLPLECDVRRFQYYYFVFFYPPPTRPKMAFRNDGINNIAVNFSKA